MRFPVSFITFEGGEGAGKVPSQARRGSYHLHSAVPSACQGRPPEGGGLAHPGRPTEADGEKRLRQVVPPEHVYDPQRRLVDYAGEKRPYHDP